MTSSLVGSEMCIRDSMHGVSEGACAVVASEGIGQIRLEDRPDGVPPVSYTHLTLPTICSV
eukprot:409972-Prorocentrum_lima.AAC.1